MRSSAVYPFGRSSGMVPPAASSAPEWILIPQGHGGTVQVERRTTSTMKLKTESATAAHHDRPRVAALVGPTLAATAPPSDQQPERAASESMPATVDLDDLLVSTNVAVLLLDREKCIRKFTPAATALFSLLPADIGRPIATSRPSSPTRASSPMSFWFSAAQRFRRRKCSRARETGTLEKCWPAGPTAEPSKGRW